MQLVLAIESARLQIQENSTAGRSEFKNPEGDRRLVFQETESWQQISLDQLVGNGWERRIGLFHNIYQTQWSLIVGVNLGDGTTTTKTYTQDGTGKLSSTIIAAPVVSLAAMSKLLSEAGIPNASELPTSIDFEKTALSFLEHVKDRNFSDPEIFSNNSNNSTIIK